MITFLLSVLPQDDGSGAAAAAGAGSSLVSLVISLLMIVALWKIFTKAGQPGWAAIIPFYNLYILLKITGKPGWWLILFLIPLVNIVIGLLVLIALANAFGKGTGFGLGLFFLSPIFFLILAFGDAQYVGAEGAARPVMA